MFALHDHLVILDCYPQHVIDKVPSCEWVHWMFFLTFSKRCVLFAAVCLSLASGIEARPSLDVISFFPVNQKDVPDANFASHPVVGRLSCPAMVEMNLLRNRHSSFLFRRVREKGLKDGKIQWRYQLEKNRKWWSGSLVTAQDVQEFFQKHLKEYLSSRLKMQVPPFSLKTDGDLILVEWKSAPRFGPYAVAGLPLWRKRSGKQWPLFECVGKYKLTRKEAHFELNAQNSKNSIIQYVTPRNEVHARDLMAKSPGQRYFAMMHSGSNNGRCRRYIDHPVFSQIVWNSSISPTKNREFRIWLDRSISREHYISAILKGNGQEATAPILFGHPGYDKKVRPDSFQPSKAKAFFLKKPASHRSLQICVARGTEEFLKSFIEMSFAAVGVKTSFQDFTKKSQCHGVLRAHNASWPDHFDLSNLAQDAYLAKSRDNLMSHLTKYMLATSRNDFQFKELRKAHAILYNQRHLSILAQHRACVEAGKGFKKRIPPLIVRNLSWFEDLLK